MEGIDDVLEECRRLENEYWASAGFRLCPAPQPFKRAAILCRKARDSSGERAICERWIAIADDYSSQDKVKRGQAANVAAGPVSRHIRERIAKIK
jgi:hypothetical protein